MNENTLMTNPLDIFSELENLPNEVFMEEMNKTEISQLIRTLTNSDDFYQILTELKTNNPKEFEAEIQSLKVLQKKSSNNEFGSKNKSEVIGAFIDEILESINEIEDFGGAFKRVSVVINRIDERARLPEYQDRGDAGLDFYLLEDCELQPRETKKVGSGLRVAIPGGYYLKMVPRSGLSLKKNLWLKNAPGTIDSGYRGEVSFILMNVGDEVITLKGGERVCQGILEKIPHIVWNEVSAEDFEQMTTNRGDNGFGSTGE